MDFLLFRGPFALFFYVLFKAAPMTFLPFSSGFCTRRKIPTIYIVYILFSCIGIS